MAETARLTLKRLTLDDIDPYQEHILDDSRVSTTLSLSLRQPNLKASIVFRAMDSHWKVHNFGMFGLFDRQTGTLIGQAGLEYAMYKGKRYANLAYGIRYDDWGKGLATEAVQYCLQMGQNELGLSEIIAMVRPDNAASRRVLDKSGMEVWQLEENLVCYHRSHALGL